MLPETKIRDCLFEKEIQMTVYQWENIIFLNRIQIFFFYKSNSTLIVEKFWLAETGRGALHMWWNNSACQKDGRHKQAPLHPAKILFLFLLPHHPILPNLFIGNHKKTAVLLSNIVITRVSSSFFYIWVTYPSH